MTLYGPGLTVDEIEECTDLTKTVIRSALRDRRFSYSGKGVKGNPKRFKFRFSANASGGAVSIRS